MEGTRIVLVRHGESRAQELGILGGHDGCQGLSLRGQRQAEALRARLEASGELSGATALYASVMPRAIETAQIIAPALGGLDVVRECDFCEGHLGEADGLTWAQVSELGTAIPVLDSWDPDHRPVPGWETWSEMSVRVARALDMVVERHPGETVVVACHGGFIVQSMLRWLSLGLQADADRGWFAPENTSITEWRFGGNPYQKQTLPLQLVRFNDHSHTVGID
jgi:probable phosphoglycerate mutase